MFNIRFRPHFYLATQHVRDTDVVLDTAVATGSDAAPSENLYTTERARPCTGYPVRNTLLGEFRQRARPIAVCVVKPVP